MEYPKKRVRIEYLKYLADLRMQECEFKMINDEKSDLWFSWWFAMKMLEKANILLYKNNWSFKAEIENEQVHNV